MARISSEQRRRDLTAAARRVLLAEGADAVTVRRVAGEAGASVASVHYVFRDKQELLDAVTGDLLAGFGEHLRRDTPVHDGLAASVEGILCAYWSWLSAEPGLARVVIEAALSPRSGGPDAVAQGEALVLELLARAARGTPPVPLPELAHLVLAAIDGITFVHLVEQDAARTARDVDLMSQALTALIP